MIVDANIIIAYLGGDEKIIDLLSDVRREGTSLLLPTIVEAEVLSFSDWTSDERRATEQFLEDNFTSIPFDRSVARVAAKIRRETKIKFPDAAIAASALVTRTPLITKNYRDFKKVAGLKIVEL